MTVFGGTRAGDEQMNKFNFPCHPKKEEDAGSPSPLLPYFGFY
jgi:hypothetical protein